TLSEELSRGNAALHQQQKRLKSLLAQIVRIKREEEILASKVELHDQLGRCVLTGRRFLRQGGQQIEPVLALWREAVENLEISLGDTEKSEDDPLRQLMDAATALGCAIAFEGELPGDRDTAYLLLSAVREAVTNAVRHAGADRVTVRLTEQGGVLVAQILDNGANHPDVVVEGGGLLNLRRRLERAGGAMEIRCESGVQLHLRLPLAGKGEQVWSMC
ncbi:MAG: ATP-binding protein, partial [Eubacteriales bacterium]|nr:ATP-binding protein [Eubacteriales bacterium]